MCDLIGYVYFSNKHFLKLSTSKTSFYINIKRFYKTNAQLNIKIYAKLYEITHKFIKKCGAPTKDERAHPLITLPARRNFLCTSC